ncbi:MAG: GNAT family N-acetyltransferase [Proteobacteria bacterium]|nr:GNAT family N-acetyltransferase [Pseudomonadota bacterium]
MVKYEKATVSEFLAIAELDREAWKLNRNSEFIPDGEHVWRLWVEHALVFLAKEANVVIGAILAFPCISKKWCVHKVFVRQDKRDLGIGTKLFDELLKEIDKIGVDCFLTVDPTNDSAIRLYEKWGFTEREFVKGYYRPNEDRFVLTRKHSEN